MPLQVSRSAGRPADEGLVRAIGVRALTASTLNCIIGVGIFVGPAVGTVTLRAFPAAAHASIWGVSGLLVVGLIALLVMRWSVMREG